MRSRLHVQGFPSLFPPNHTHSFLQNNCPLPFSRENMVVLFHIVPVLSIAPFFYLEVDCFFSLFFRFICSVSSLRSTLFLQVTLQSWPSLLLLFACTCSLSAKLRDLVALTFACDGMSTKDLFAGMRGRKGINIEKDGSNEPETKEERAI